MWRNVRPGHPVVEKGFVGSRNVNTYVAWQCALCCYFIVSCGKLLVWSDACWSSDAFCDARSKDPSRSSLRSNESTTQTLRFWRIYHSSQCILSFSTSLAWLGNETAMTMQAHCRNKKLAGKLLWTRWRCITNGHSKRLSLFGWYCRLAYHEHESLQMKRILLGLTETETKHWQTNREKNIL